MLLYFIENFPDAKGSSGNHQFFPGGYYKHVSDILNYAKKMYKSFKDLPFSFDDVIIVLFLHDIEKPFKYSTNKHRLCDKADSHIREIMIKTFKLKLSEEQKAGLKHIHGEGNDYRKSERIMSPLSAFCHCCDTISARIFYN
jgi:hypothetical protein